MKAGLVTWNHIHSGLSFIMTDFLVHFRFRKWMRCLV